MGYISAYKLVIMSIYTNNWESVMDLDNKMHNSDKKNNKEKKKNEKNWQKTFLFIKKSFLLK